jgi:hypothetical protein
MCRRRRLLASTIAVSLLAAGSNAQSSSGLSNQATGTATTGGVNTASGGTSKATGTASTGVVITGSSTTGQATGAVITGSSATSVGALVSGLPTLTGGYVIVAPSVPPTADAPFMQRSKLPEGTVFIVVGALLGFMAMSVLLWRGLVAWSLHRSVKRVAELQNMVETKALFHRPGKPAAPLYKYADRDSTLSVGGLGPKNGKKHTHQTNSNAPAANLFFSPTAGAGASLANPGNRGSAYLPAGYYAAGASAPAGGAGHIPVGHGPAISTSNIGSYNTGYSRGQSRGPSPPDSPSTAGDRDSRHMASSSTLNLDRGYGGQEKAPRPFLNDMFDENRPPPPPEHRTRHARNNSGSPSRQKY